MRPSIDVLGSCERRACLILWVVAFVFPLALAWQGIDVTDTGYCLVEYQRFFAGLPDSHQAPGTSLFYVTMLIGGVWQSLFGDLGSLGFRVLNVLTVWLIVFLCYQTLRGIARPFVALAAVVCALLLVCPGSFTFLHYNTVTALFLTVTVYALFRGITRRSMAWLAGAGAACAACAFARLPNVAFIAVAATIPLDAWLAREEGGVWRRRLVVFVGGLARLQHFAS